ncbi:variable large family protein [Borrelia hermsii]|uniref:Variable large protein n=3 Tax=Borrelia hermsii TaxID=140 RepID=Q1CNZ7_BORHD|nr:variable large family protein [Borrelia hermsii]ABF82164.1 VlpD36sil [Borrelia hermsii DAH]AMR76179.1 Variable large protein D36 [Borrelia hermsii]ANA43904.1 VlpD36 [Borrelia hermsii HS1]UPA08613.1 variable large family protein [Borrelia hermsii DAH]
MRKRIRAIIMTLFMVLVSCNSGGVAEDPKHVYLTSIANLGKGFLDVFVTFGDMVTGAFGIKADTKKSDIGKYFTDIESTMTAVKNKLQDEVAKNGNYAKVKTVVDKFVADVLDKIAAGAKEAASGLKDANGNLGAVEKAADASKGADATSVGNLVKGIKNIVDIALKSNEGDGAKDVTSPAVDDKKKIGKLFGDKTGNGAEEKHIAAASASIGAVSGVDILQAIARSSDKAASGKASEAKDAAGLAMANGDSTETTDLDEAAKKDAVIAAGIVLRAIAKDGKFIVKDTGDNKTEAEAAKGVAASAVGKTLSTLIIAIRNTVDSGLKTINEVLAKVKQEDKSAEATNTAEATTSGPVNN